MYGKRRAPLPEQLEDLDALVFDIQDIGTRFYTYISTMGYSMEAASKAGVKFIVLDRLNPITGSMIAGPVLDGKTGFVGWHEIPVRPGKKIGHITGEEINQVQSAMTDYMKNNGIAGPKILIVHMFTAGMVKDKDLIKNYDNIKLVMNLDGHGSPQLKTNIYNGLYTETVSAKVAGGFKLFFHEDKPSMMTPKQVMGMEPVNKSRIKEPPRYINYQ